LTSVFTQTAKASQTYAAKYSEKEYLERTKRNHYWLGGPEGQKKLRDMKVGVAGLGGMGSNLAEIMVRLGVGHIKIADFDTIEHSNINRQVIANKNTIGMKKAHAAAAEFRNIAEDFELVVYDDGLTKQNAEEFVSDLDVIIDEIDVFPFRAHVWLHQAARKKNLPLYSGFIIGLGTHVYKFQGSDYTFEDFMLNNEKEMDNPSSEFMMDRLFNPPPSYLEDPKARKIFAQTIDDKTVPIFGATTYISHSLLAIRVITDYLDLNKTLGGMKTPLMPKFMKLDPFDLTMQVCEVKNRSL
jgi:molybdopterin/thiamine biosynthesis adenylyltransferase